ncbi:MAG: hypothetical protein ACFFB3_12345 [Candidatus Hodarchaeota archaeon]
MIKKKTENLLAKELKRNFDQCDPPKFGRIFASKRPFQVPKLKKQWHNTYGLPLGVPTTLIPPLQPEIDMILCKRDTLIAVELKHFKRKGRSLNHSFYEGIEQALALLRWGFDHVALWQLFEESISPAELWFYGGWTWKFLHAEPKDGGLKLPLEFTFMRVTKGESGYDFRPIQPRRIEGSIRLDLLLPPYDPNFYITTPHKNPLLRCPEVQKLREMLVDWLETQKA